MQGKCWHRSGSGARSPASPQAPALDLCSEAASTHICVPIARAGYGRTLEESLAKCILRRKGRSNCFNPLAEDEINGNELQQVGCCPVHPFFKDRPLLSLAQGRLLGLRWLDDCLWLSRERICLILAELN